MDLDVTPIVFRPLLAQKRPIIQSTLATALARPHRLTFHVGVCEVEGIHDTTGEDSRAEMSNQSRLRRDHRRDAQESVAGVPRASQENDQKL